MVLLKITDGIETRRLQVTPGETTFQQLQERMALLFPGAANIEVSTLTLCYHDSDGDVITLSTDEEFQEVLSDLPSDYIWKLHIHKARPHYHRVSYCLLRPPFTPRRHLHQSRLDRQLKELIELILRFGDTSISDEEPTGTHHREERTNIPQQETTKSSASEGSAEPSSRGKQSGITGEGMEPSKAALQEEEMTCKHPKKASGLECPAGHHCHVICGSPPCLRDCLDPSCSLQ